MTNLQCLIQILRTFINDLNSSEYDDDTLTSILALATSFVHTDLGTCSSVTKPDFCYCLDTPNFDPCEYPEFSNLVALKAACILQQNAARQLVERSGVKAVCGPSSISLTTSSSALNLLFTKGPCEGYEDLKDELCYNYTQEIADACGQVCSVFTSSNYFTEGWCEKCCRKTSSCRC